MKRSIKHLHSYLLMAPHTAIWPIAAKNELEHQARTHPTRRSWLCRVLVTRGQRGRARAYLVHAYPLSTIGAVPLRPLLLRQPLRPAAVQELHKE